MRDCSRELECPIPYCKLPRRRRHNHGWVPSAELGAKSRSSRRGQNPPEFTTPIPGERLSARMAINPPHPCSRCAEWKRGGVRIGHRASGNDLVESDFSRVEVTVCPPQRAPIAGAWHGFALWVFTSRNGLCRVGLHNNNFVTYSRSGRLDLHEKDNVGNAFQLAELESVVSERSIKTFHKNGVKGGAMVAATDTSMPRPWNRETIESLWINV